MATNGQEMHSKYRYPAQGTWKDPQIGKGRNSCTCRSWIGSSDFRRAMTEKAKEKKGNGK